MTAEEFDKRYCEKLNKEQLVAVHSVNGPVMILAVPGSGKTTVLVKRLGYMMLVCGIEAKNIAAITYTNAATEELKERCIKDYGEIAQTIRFSTINSLCMTILKFSAQKSGKNLPSMVSYQKQKEVIEEALLERKVDPKNIRRAISLISLIKNNMLDKEKQDEVGKEICEKFSEIYEFYNNSLNAEGLMDFDDQMLFALKELKDPYFKGITENTFKYICVDEAQDTSLLQFAVIEAIAEGNKNLFIVGDEDQSIYGFRGATTTNILSFNSRYPQAKVVKIQENYRSSEGITSVANRFVKQNKNRIDKEIISTKPYGKRVQIVKCSMHRYQYDYAARLAIRKYKENKSVAIIYRNNSSSIPFLTYFTAYKTPYSVRKLEGELIDPAIIRDFECILAIAQKEEDPERFVDVLSMLGERASKKELESAKKNYKERKKKDNFIEELVAVTQSIQKKTRLEAIAKEFNKLNDVSGREAFNILLRRIGYRREIDEITKQGIEFLADRCDNFKALCESIKDVCSTADMMRGNKGIILTTAHSSKGLEFDVVIMVDIKDGVFPASPKTEDDKSRNLGEEERRLFYVALTRAKEELYLIDVKGISSSYIEEIEKYIPQIRSEEGVLHFNISDSSMFYDKNLGAGEIKALCDENVLIKFEKKYMLYSLPELVINQQIFYDTGKVESVETKAVKKDESFTLEKGDRVEHKEYGIGEVMEIEDKDAYINFEAGMKRIRYKIAAKTLALRKIP